MKRYLLIPALLLIGCNSTEPVEPEPDITVIVSHPKACIESFPVLPDTVVKGLEKYSLKVGNGPRNRCSYSEFSDLVICKGKNQDTIYTVDTYCPATLKLKTELGGN